jgi:hypothetical protein
LEILKESLKALEGCRRKLLGEKEALWSQKSRVIWLAKGDDNTKFFQAYAKGRKTNNTIWHLKDKEGREVSSFEGLAQMGRNHFQTLFKAPERVNIVDIVGMALLFPSFVDEEGNRDLFVEVTEDELKEFLHSFQKDKILGLERLDGGILYWLF